MSELAYNYKGRRFVPPAEAMFWRVRRIREGQRGQLEVVRGADGRPLVVPIDIGVEAFRLAVGDREGRYRLDALDEGEMEVADVEAAYVTVPLSQPTDEEAAEEEEVAPRVATAALRNAAPVAAAVVMPAPGATVTAPFGTWPALPMPAMFSGTEYLLAEAMRGHAHMCQVMAAGTSQMMNAAAELLRAADSAGITRRVAHEVVPPAPPAAPVPPSVPPAGGPSGPASEAPRNAAPADAEDEGDEDDEDDDGEEYEERAEARTYGYARRRADGLDARTAEDAGDEREQEDQGDEDQGDEDQGDEEDASTDADIMSRLMTLADKVQGALAPVADVARLVVGGFGGGGLRNAQGEAEDEGEAGEVDGEVDVAPVAAPAIPAYLRISHMQAIGYELGPQGSRFRRIVMAMEPTEQKALTDHLCSMPLDEAVADVRAKLASIPAPRRARVVDPVGAPAPVMMPPPVVVVEPAPVGGEPACAVVEGHDEVVASPAAMPSGGERSDDAREAASSGDEHDRSDEPSEPAPAVPGPTSTLVPAPAPSHAQVPAGPRARSATKGTASPPATIVAKTAPTPAEVQAQLLEIVRHLSMPEILRVQSLAAGLSADDRAAWLARLAGLSPKAAAAAIRAELAKR